MNCPFGDMIYKTVVIFFIIYLFVNIIYLGIAFCSSILLCCFCFFFKTSVLFISCFAKYVLTLQKFCARMRVTLKIKIINY